MAAVRELNEFVRELNEFAVDVVTKSGDRVVVRVSGELDVCTAPTLKGRLNELIDDGAREIAVDLADLEFINTTGLCVFVKTLERLRPHDGRLLLRSPNRSVHKTLEITGLDQTLLAG